MFCKYYKVANGDVKPEISCKQVLRVLVREIYSLIIGMYLIISSVFVRRYGSGDPLKVGLSNIQEVRVFQSAQREARFSKTDMSSGSHFLDL